MCAFVVLGLVFHIRPRDWLGERLQSDLFLCLMGRKTLTQSISQSSY